MTLARDLVRPAIDLNFGPQQAYPQVKIGLGEQRNLELIMKNLGEMIDRGMEVEASQIYPMFGLTEPAKGKDVVLLKPVARPQPGEQPGGPPSPPQDGRADPPGGGGALPPKRPTATLAAQEWAPAPPDAIDKLADELADPALLDDLRQRIEAAIDESTSLEELKARIEALATTPAGKKLVEMLGTAMFNARLAGALGAPLREQADL